MAHFLMLFISSETGFKMELAVKTYPDLDGCLDGWILILFLCLLKNPSFFLSCLVT